MTCCNWRSHPTKILIIITVTFFLFARDFKSHHKANPGIPLWPMSYALCIALLTFWERSINFFHQKLSGHDITIKLSPVLENQLSLTKMSSNLFSTREAQSLQDFKYQILLLKLGLGVLLQSQEGKGKGSSMCSFSINR